MTFSITRIGMASRDYHYRVHCLTNVSTYLILLDVHADDWHLVFDCLAAVGQPQQDEACGTGAWAGHSHG